MLQDRLFAKLETKLAESFDGFIALDSCERLSGGASQETYCIKITLRGGPLKLAMRRAAGGEEVLFSKQGPGLLVEAQLFEAAHKAGVPVPKIYSILQPEDGLGPGFIMQWLDGETLGARINKLPELEEVRPKLAFECGNILAKIHDIDVSANGLSGALSTMSSKTLVEDMWAEYRAFNAPQPMIDYTALWLLDNLPPDIDYRLTHNDFRNGNLMVTPKGIAAVLDWELAYIGDPVRDLGWMCTNSWRFGSYDLPVGGFGTREDLLAGYKAQSGRDIDPQHLHFWEVFGSFWWAIGCLKMVDGWRNGPDPNVERPAIGRRSSECQADCVNLIISGPVALAAPDETATSLGMPNMHELLSSVRDFLRQDARQELTGRNNFLALVASNTLDIVQRELSLGGAIAAAEKTRLMALLGKEDTLEALRWQLVGSLRDGSMTLNHSGLAAHLRETVINQLAVDQPKYSGLKAALSQI
jgi:aminoglycoside phosphotransferase (APT) family kinase protein